MRFCSVILVVFVACQLLAAVAAIPTEVLSLGKVTSQSSTRAAGGASSRAVDGNPDSNWHGNSCTHTNTEKTPWWAVDLGAPAAVHIVAIVNRKDSRLTNFNIGVTNEDPNSVTPSVSGPNYQLCKHVSGTQIHITRKYYCDKPLRGRYLVVQLKATSHLTLCQVTVYGASNVGQCVSSCADKADGDYQSCNGCDVYATCSNKALNDNILCRRLDLPLGSLWDDILKLCAKTSRTCVALLSKGQVTSQSSTRPGGGASSRGVDGNLDSNWYDGSCTHTIVTPEKNPWWAVDLGGTRIVHYVTLVNRGDCCLDRLVNFNIGVTDEDPSSVTPSVTPNYQVCAYNPNDQTTIQVKYDCSKHLTGRYVVVQLKSTSPLTLCEVMVYGTA